MPARPKSRLVKAWPPGSISASESLAQQIAVKQIGQKEFESKIAHQQKQIEALTAGLQKVSAQVELNKPAPQMVAENQ